MTPLVCDFLLKDIRDHSLNIRSCLSDFQLMPAFTSILVYLTSNLKESL